MKIMELQPEYLNAVANQLVVINSLLAGFSIAVAANLMVNDSKKRILNAIFKATIIAASCFLICVFAMTKILMMTTKGYPINYSYDALHSPMIVGFGAFFLGIAALSVLIAMSGWIRSKKTGILTTVVGVVTFVMILIHL